MAEVGLVEDQRLESGNLREFENPDAIEAAAARKGLDESLEAGAPPEPPTPALAQEGMAAFVAGQEPQSPATATARLVMALMTGGDTAALLEGVNVGKNIIVAKKFTDAAAAELLKLLMQLFGIEEITRKVLDEINTWFGENSWNSEEQMKSVLKRKNPRMLKQLGYPLTEEEEEGDEEDEEEEGGIIPDPPLRPPQGGGSSSAQRPTGVAGQTATAAAEAARPTGVAGQTATAAAAAARTAGQTATAVATRVAATPLLSRHAMLVLLLFVFMLMCTFAIWGRDIGVFNRIINYLGTEIVGKGLKKKIGPMGVAGALPFLSSLAESAFYLMNSTHPTKTRLRNVAIISGSTLVAGYLMMGSYALFNFIPMLFGTDGSGHIFAYETGVLLAASAHAQFEALWGGDARPEGWGKHLIKIFLVIFLFLLCVGTLTTVVGTKPSGERFHTLGESILGMVQSGASFAGVYPAVLHLFRSQGWEVSVQRPGGFGMVAPPHSGAEKAPAAPASAVPHPKSKGGGKYKNSKRRTRKRCTRKRRTRKRHTRKRRKTPVKKTRLRKYSRNR